MGDSYSDVIVRPQMVTAQIAFGLPDDCVKPNAFVESTANADGTESKRLFGLF